MHYLRSVVYYGPFAWLLFAMALLQASGGFAGSETVPLGVAVESLRRQGIDVLYSSDLVPKGLEVQMDEISIPALQQALANVGLALRQKGAVWIIVLAEATQAKVTGYLVSSSGDPVINGEVQLLRSKTVSRSDRDGKFNLAQLEDNDVLVIRAEGYHKRLLTVDASDLGRITLQSVRQIENIIVTGSRYLFPARTDDSAFSSVFNLTAEEMHLTPALAGDAMRVTTRLPGVSSVGVSAKPRFRGGLPDEVLILFDGVELLEPFHLSSFQSGFSSIDSRTVESIDIYTGGFPARYGNRMSGVMDVTTDSAQTDFPTEIGLSNFSVFANSRGQTTGNKPVAWLLSARRGDLRDLTEFMEPREGKPKYADAFARVSTSLGDRDELTLAGLATKDEAGFIDDEEEASADVNSHYLWARLDMRYRDDFRGSFLLSTLRTSREKHEASAEEDGKQGVVDYSQVTRVVSLRNNNSLVVGEHLFEFGLQVAYNEAEYNYSGLFDRGELADFFNTERFVNKLISRKPHGWSGGLYAAAEYKITPTLKILPGIRWDFQNYCFSCAVQQTSPRFGLAYDLTDYARLRFNIGRFYQSEGIHELQALDGTEQFFTSQRSDQVIMGLDWWHDRLAFRGEFYYKRYRDQKQRFENLFNPFVLVPEIEPDRVNIVPEKAFARGFDAEARLAFNPQLTGILRYSYMNAKDRVERVWVPRRWSQRHTWNALLGWARDGVTLSGAVAWHSGWHTSRLPNELPFGEVIPVATVLNNMELRAYLSLDISASKSWRVGGNKITLYSDITNLTDHKNIAGIDFDVETTGNSVSFVPVNETLLSRIISVGITISF